MELRNWCSTTTIENQLAITKIPYIKNKKLIHWNQQIMEYLLTNRTLTHWTLESNWSKSSNTSKLICRIENGCLLWAELRFYSTSVALHITKNGFGDELHQSTGELKFFWHGLADIPICSGLADIPCIVFLIQTHS